MNKTVKWLLIALAIIVALVIIILAIKYFMDQSANNNTQPPVPPVQTGNVITDALSALFSGSFLTNLFGGKKCDPNRPGYQMNGDFNPAKCPTGPAQQYKCDCSKPGYTTAGAYKESCKEGRVDYMIDCG